MMFDYKKIIRNRETRLKVAGLMRIIPTPLYLKLVYRFKTGMKLNLKNPKTFCDKLNWLKFHDFHPEYTDYVDKIKIHDIIEKKLGKDICFPIIGVWDSFDDIDFNELPDKFVLKCNHDSGSVKVVDKNAGYDTNELREFYSYRLKMNAYDAGREYPYKDVKAKIFAEKYMLPDESTDIKDYKFFCFNGVPKMLYVASDRRNQCKFDFYDLDFNHLDISDAGHPHSVEKISKPENFEKMINISKKLSQNMKFVRIDLYEINGEVYFGEFTFFHCGGFWPLKPIEWENKLGEFIDINC